MLQKVSMQYYVIINLNIRTYDIVQCEILVYEKSDKWKIVLCNYCRNFSLTVCHTKSYFFSYHNLSHAKITNSKKRGFEEKKSEKFSSKIYIFRNFNNTIISVFFVDANFYRIDRMIWKKKQKRISSFDIKFKIYSNFVQFIT